MTEDVVIRTAKVEDAAKVLQIQREVIAEGSYSVTVSEEFDSTVENHWDWIAEILHNDRETMLVAETSKGIVGWIVFLSANKIRLSHTGSLAMMIEKNSRHMGIGRLLVTGIIDWAKSNPHIEKVSLGVLATNTRAIALYKKMGFIEEGRKIKEFKLDHGEYVDDILMYQLV